MDSGDVNRGVIKFSNLKRCDNCNVPRGTTYFFIGIHPRRVEPASSIALTASRTEALQVRQSCASSPDTFTFLHRA